MSMAVNSVKVEVKDNQWWFSKSSLRSAVESSPFVELSIAGRRCVLERSADGSNGKPTYSFKFLRDDDRQFWRSLNGKLVDLEVTQLLDAKPDFDDDQEDEFEDCVETKPLVIKDEAEASLNLKIERSSNSSLFDVYIFVDWSANNAPKSGKDSIWIAEGQWAGPYLQFYAGEDGCVNPKTRQKATAHLQDRLLEHTASNRRVLICFDFAYSYPVCAESQRFSNGFCSFSERLTNLITDDSKNKSNRFQVADLLNQEVSSLSGEGPFWGRPTSGSSGLLTHLKSTKPTDWKERAGLKEFRIVEERLRKRRVRPFSVWQLFGNGSVGSQLLVGLPTVHTLRKATGLSDCSKVWPFETGWVTEFDDTTKIVHAEFWPGTIPFRPWLHGVRDAAQVLSCVAWAAEQDAVGNLGTFFDPLSEKDPERSTALSEGWILGVTEKEI